MFNSKARKDISTVLESLKKSGLGIQIGKTNVKKAYSSGVGKSGKGEFHVRDKQ